MIGIVDIYGNPFTSQKHLGFDSIIPIVATLIICCFIRLWQKELVLQKGVKVLLLVTCCTTFFMSIGLTLLDFFTPDNYVYSLFQLNYQRMFVIGIFSGVILLLNQSNTWFLTYKKILILLTAPLLTGIFLIVSLFPFNLLFELNREDNIVEHMQFVTLLIALFYASNVSIAFFKKKQFLLSSIFIVLSFGILVVAGDEISWGQRFIGIQTPESIAKHNMQNEITWHNIAQLNSIPTLSYIIIGFYGSLSWIYTRYIHSKKLLLFIVPSILFFYFFIPLLVNLRFLLGDHHLGVWAEPSELLLYMGTALYFYLLYSNIKTPNRKKNGNNIYANKK